MVGLQSMEVAGQRFVLLAESEYERLCRDAGQPMRSSDDSLPSLPKVDRNGRYPALEYARISLARDLIRARHEVKLSQQEVANRAGIRQETLSRIETGKHTATPKTVDKVMQVIETERKILHKKKGR